MSSVANIKLYEVLAKPKILNEAVSSKDEISSNFQNSESNKEENSSKSKDILKSFSTPSLEELGDHMAQWSDKILLALDRYYSR